MSDVVCEVIAQLPTKYGTFEAHGYVDQRSGEHHVALVKGDIADGEPVLCRVHSECLTGDTFGSLRCDCGCLLYTSPSPRDGLLSRMPSSA